MGEYKVTREVNVTDSTELSDAKQTGAQQGNKQVARNPKISKLQLNAFESNKDNAS